MTLLSRMMWAAIAGMVFSGWAHAACLPVTEDPALKLNPSGAAALARIGYGRPELFTAMRETSLPEAHGCWASPTGNSDGQVVSAGLAQWNYGQGTLQLLLRSLTTRLGSPEQFRQIIGAHMPVYGALIFSPGCLQPSISAACRAAMIAAQPNGRLNDAMSSELVWLFESQAMRQVQMDQFAGLLTKMIDDLVWVFPNTKPTPLQIKWAIDTRVQQNRFVNRDELRRFYLRSQDYSVQQRAEKTRSTILWYQALCGDGTQEGVRYDCAYNIDQWSKAAGTIDRQRFELIFMSYLRARTANGREGAYQADAFQRRAAIAFGVGSVHGQRIAP